MYAIDTVLQKAKERNIRIAFIHNLSMNEPLGIGYLSAYLKSHFSNITIDFFDLSVISLKLIKNFSPMFVLYSVMTGQHKKYIELNKRLKESLCPFISVFGGAHSTYFPEMITNDGVDIVCRGEGEEPLKNLIKNTLSYSDIRYIKSLWVKYDSAIYNNEVDYLIEDQDSLPFPDRDLYYRKSRFLRKYGRKLVFLARGCPFKCSYCYNSGLNSLFKGKGKVLRCRSPKSVVEEIKALKAKCYVGFVEFCADIFPGINIEWLKEFEDRYSRVKIPFYASLRTEFVNPEMAKHLRKSGCVSAGLGIEIADYEYRKKYLFRNMTNENIVEATKILESEGIRVASPIMLGLPFTTIQDDLDTLKLVCKVKPTHSNTTIFQPYPGTALTDLCLKHNLMDKIDIDNLNENFYSPAHIKNIDYEKVMKLHNSYALLRILYKWFNIDIDKYFEKLPDSSIIKIINILLKYLTFKKIINFKRNPLERIKEIRHALTTGVYGFSINKKRFIAVKGGLLNE